jgi:hypothetical protein
MGELIALAVCVAGLASYTAIGFVIHSTSTIAKIASFGIGIPYTAVASLFAVSPTDSLSVTEASAPKIDILTLLVVTVGVTIATKSVRFNRGG